MDNPFLREVLAHDEMIPGIWRLVIRYDGEIKPGQFAHVKCGERLLRRPISICDAQGGAVTLIYEVRGDGTAELTRVRAGELLDVLLPLGNSFTLYDDRKVALVGGGIGIFPLLLLARHYRSSAHAILGCRDGSRVLLQAEFGGCCGLSIATDDGSLGHHGYVHEVLEQHIRRDRPDIVYACGPEPMLRTVQDITRREGLPCELSLEQRMGCGVGACLVCACRVKTARGETYEHVCKQGPIFDARRVVFDV